jgi:hypothetical protein
MMFTNMKYVDSIISNKQRREMDAWNNWFGVLTCFWGRYTIL